MIKLESRKKSEVMIKLNTRQDKTIDAYMNNQKLYIGAVKQLNKMISDDKEMLLNIMKDYFGFNDDYLLNLPKRDVFVIRTSKPLGNKFFTKIQKLNRKYLVTVHGSQIQVIVYLDKMVDE